MLIDVDVVVVLPSAEVAVTVTECVPAIGFSMIDVPQSPDGPTVMGCVLGSEADRSQLVSSVILVRPERKGPPYALVERMI